MFVRDAFEDALTNYFTSQYIPIQDMTTKELEMKCGQIAAAGMRASKEMYLL